MADKMIRNAVRSPEGKAKAQAGDSEGNTKQVSVKNNQEIKHIKNKSLASGESVTVIDKLGIEDFKKIYAHGVCSHYLNKITISIEWRANISQGMVSSVHTTEETGVGKVMILPINVMSPLISVLIKNEGKDTHNVDVYLGGIK